MSKPEAAHDEEALGLGLPTIGQLSDTLDVQSGPGGVGTEVPMVFAAPGAGPPPGPGGPAGRAVPAEVARIARDGAWPNDDVGRPPAAIVPALADACALDLVDAEGVPRRVAGRITGPRTVEDSHRLGTLRPRFNDEEIDFFARLARP